MRGDGKEGMGEERRIGKGRRGQVGGEGLGGWEGRGEEGRNRDGEVDRYEGKGWQKGEEMSRG